MDGLDWKGNEGNEGLSNPDGQSPVPPINQSISGFNPSSTIFREGFPAMALQKFPGAMNSNQANEPPGKILIVDDEIDAANPLSELLLDAGYQVKSVAARSEAGMIAATEQPDLILLDINRPQTNGYVLCRQLKAAAQTADIPIIFFGGSEPKDAPVRAFAAGGADYICKPFWFEEVVARINHQIKTSRHHQKLQDQARRVLNAPGKSPLLIQLQRTLHRQTEKLKQQNDLLQQQILDRQQAENSLLIEKHKSEQLLLNILPRAVVEKLKQFQGSLAERFDEATVLFADIVNFTSLASQISPLELVNMLNQIFSTFDCLAEQYGLEKIKTIGDAYMLVGGAPIPNSDHAETVMEMAIAMQQEIQYFTRADGEPLQLRIGINTGAVVAGVIGVKKFSYDLWGDAVNVASRMESQGMAGKIQVTEFTCQRLKHKYDFEQVGRVSIKGKGQMTTYHLLGRKGDGGKTDD